MITAAESERLTSRSRRERKGGGTAPESWPSAELKKPARRRLRQYRYAMLAGRLQRCTTTLAARMENAVRVPRHLPSARRCAMPRVPRQLPSLPPPKPAGANSELDKTWGQGQLKCASGDINLGTVLRLNSQVISWDDENGRGPRRAVKVDPRIGDKAFFCKAKLSAA